MYIYIECMYINFMTNLLATLFLHYIINMQRALLSYLQKYSLITSNWNSGA